MQDEHVIYNTLHINAGDLILMWLTGGCHNSPRRRMSIGFTYDLLMEYPKGRDAVVRCIKKWVNSQSGKRRHQDNGHYGEKMALCNYITRFECAYYWFPTLTTRGGNTIYYNKTRCYNVTIRNGSSFN